VARKQVAARIEGDLYQGMFFWHQAVPMLVDTTQIERVTLEHDQVTGVDDLAVFYSSPGIDAGGWMCEADFFQVKYHVDNRNAYSATTICDPALIGGKHSLLQHFHQAHEQLSGRYSGYRLNLISNWSWSTDDCLAPFLRDSEGGALPDHFFAAGSRSKLGKVRERWREHLNLAPGKFDAFARRLRLGLNFFGRRDFRAWLSDRLARHALRPIPEDRLQNPYDSLVQQFILNGKTDFDRKTFREICHREGLIDKSNTPGPRRLGVRSFLRFAERIEDECDGSLCLIKYFDKRHIKSPELWNGSIASELRAFLNDPLLRRTEHQLLLDCHSSVAFASGYELSRKSGCQVFPVQKGVVTQVWRPGGNSDPASLSVRRTEGSQSSMDVALALSITRDVRSDVEKHLERQGRAFRALVDVRTPKLGAGSIVGPDHAVAIADAVADIIRKEQRGADRTVHLFSAAPNALLFFLGQHREALGRIQLYEFDFEGSRGGDYAASLRLPE
jgi:SMODS-associated and fused to various effectors sensor domain